MTSKNDQDCAHLDLCAILTEDVKPNRYEDVTYNTFSNIYVLLSLTIFDLHI